MAAEELLAGGVERPGIFSETPVTTFAMGVSGTNASITYFM